MNTYATRTIICSLLLLCAHTGFADPGNNVCLLVLEALQKNAERDGNENSRLHFPRDPRRENAYLERVVPISSWEKRWKIVLGRYFESYRDSRWRISPGKSNLWEAYSDSERLAIATEVAETVWYWTEYDHDLAKTIKPEEEMETYLALGTIGEIPKWHRLSARKWSVAFSPSLFTTPSWKASNGGVCRHQAPAIIGNLLELGFPDSHLRLVEGEQSREIRHVWPEVLIDSQWMELEPGASERYPMAQEYRHPYAKSWRPIQARDNRDNRDSRDDPWPVFLRNLEILRAKKIQGDLLRTKAWY